MYDPQQATRLISGRERWNMDTERLEEQIIACGREFFAEIERHKPSVFSIEKWTGKLMEWTMSRQALKTEIFKLIDVLPELTSEQMVFGHIERSFLGADDLPGLLRLGLKTAGLMGKPGRKLVGAIVRKSVRIMALQFIAGNDVEGTVARLRKLREKEGFAFTLDVLGEETDDEEKAGRYVQSYIRLLEGLRDVQHDWKSLAQVDSPLDWGTDPRINISVKPSALYSSPDPDNFENTVEHILARLKNIYREVVKTGAFLCIDIEMLRLREITFEVYRRLRGDPEFRAYPHLGIAMQVYLKDHAEQLDKMLAWARNESLPISIRLTKGAYWDYEVQLARQQGRPVPVYAIKAQSDIAFEKAAEKILLNHGICHLACASHNLRSISAVIELAKSLNVPGDRYEFQVLYGMAAAVRKSILEKTGRVRLYCPHGRLLPGMAYLVRRLLENTSNESFLYQTFAKGVDKDLLLENPTVMLDRIRAGRTEADCHLIGGSICDKTIDSCR